MDTHEKNIENAFAAYFKRWGGDAEEAPGDQGPPRKKAKSSKTASAASAPAPAPTPARAPAPAPAPAPKESEVVAEAAVGEGDVFLAAVR